jgi:hypothetical protein
MNPTTGVERRPASEGEWCTCGRPAVEVFKTARGEVGWCGLTDVPQVVPCRWCASHEPHRDSRCPGYRLTDEQGETGDRS